MQTDSLTLRYPTVRWFGALPVVQRHVAAPSAAETARVEALARKLAANEPALSATSAFGPLVDVGMADGPALYLGDHADTELLPETHLQAYDYRMASLAGAGDHTAIYGARDPVFEDYRHAVLGLPRLDVTEAAPGGQRPHQLALRVRDDAAAVEKLAASARQAGRFSIVPYQGNGGAWALAMQVAAVAQTPVRVCAPPPRLARRVNDKAWFAARVAEVCGRQARPAHGLAFGPSGLVARLERLAANGASVVVKVPSSAGSLGNIVLDADTVQATSALALRDRVVEQLAARGWGETYPLLVEAWDAPLIKSPSVQLWIPGPGEPAIIEGVYEQMVEGPSARFVGAVETSLPDRLVGQLCHEAALLGHLLQRLGYFGRCSFDAVVFGADMGTAKIHWIECNGRWGGVSIPMTLANRLTADRAEEPEILIFRHLFEGPPVATAAVLDALAPVLFRAGATRHGVVMFTPPRPVPRPKTHLLAIAGSGEAAQTLAARATQLLEAIG